MKSYQEDISFLEARIETQDYIEIGAERLRARLQEKKIAHA